MFCDNCGKRIPDGKTTCDACLAELNGTPAPAPVPTPAAPAPAPVANGFRPASLDMFDLDQEPAAPVMPEVSAPVPEASIPLPMPETPAAAEAPAFELNTAVAEPSKKKKKKGKGKWIFLSIVALVLVVGIVLAVVNWASIVRFFKRTFSDPTEYLVDVEEAAMADSAASLSEAYGQWLESATATDTNSQTDVTLEISDETKLLLEAMGGSDLGIDWLDSILIQTNSNVNGDMLQLDMGVGVNDTNLVTLSMIFDMASEKIWFGLPEMNASYVVMDFAEFFGSDEDFLDALQQEQDGTRKLMESLPTADELEDLLNTYYGILLDHVKDVEKETKTVEIDGIEQEQLVLTVEFSYEDLRQIAIDVLAQAKDDPVIKKALDGLSTYYNETAYSYEGSGTVDLYASFAEYADQALAELEAEEADDDTALTLSTYLDDEDKIVGRSLTVEESGLEEIYYLTVSDGEKFAVEAQADALKLTGDGKTVDGVTDAEFKLSVDGSRYLGLVVKDLVTQEDGAVSGTIRLTPGKAFYEQMGIDASVLTSFGGMIVLEMVVDTTGDADVVEVSLLAATFDLFTIRISSEALETQPVTAPANAVSFEDEAASMEWLKALDFEGLAQRMEQAGIPKEYADSVREMGEELKAEATK